MGDERLTFAFQLLTNVLNTAGNQASEVVPTMG
jgi:hypothetical protein